jgi:hypothetical protein
MNEGCHGGWGIFHGIWLEDYYTVAEYGAPYQAITGSDMCKNYANLEPLAKVSKTYYIGGHYNGMSERDMMWELRAKGPYLFDFNAGQAFQLYRNGVLSEEGYPSQLKYLDEVTREEVTSDSKEDEPNDMTPEDFGIQYEKLTHSTLLIGWGTERQADGSDLSYWIVRNSYGSRWGEGGNFRIRRGLNDFAGEAENSAVEPLLFGSDRQIRPHGF